MERTGEGSVLEIARRQAGVVTGQQCSECGHSKKFIERRIQMGAWRRLHRGVFKIGLGPVTSDEEDVAALLATGPEAVLSHLSAARRLGLDVPKPREVQVMAPQAVRRRTRSGIELWRSRDLLPSDLVVKGPFRLTQLPRTLLDLASILVDERLRAALDSAARNYRAALPWIRRGIGARGKGHPGAARLGRMLDSYGLREEIPDSVMESLALELFRHTQFPPSLHHRVETAGCSIEVDLAWPERKVCVELDSWKHHGSREAFRRDRARDRGLSAAGWTVLRYTWAEVERGQEQLLCEVSHCLARSREVTTKPSVASTRPLNRRRAD